MPKKMEDGEIDEFFDVVWVPVSVRFSVKEHAKIKQAAARRGVSLNSLVRQACKHAAEKVLQAPSADDELRRIVLPD